MLFCKLVGCNKNESQIYSCHGQQEKLKMQIIKSVIIVSYFSI